MRVVDHQSAVSPSIYRDSGGLEQLLIFYIRSINIIVSRALDTKSSGLDVTKGTGKISTLLIFPRHPGIRPSAIAALIMRDRSAMGRWGVRLSPLLSMRSIKCPNSIGRVLINPLPDG
ncbi:hypothetical protein [Erwinia endophytica]|uniref:hypothetical protein n=1 Tax=Erwinia endophytica TaxID=1563158 RepID=UPI0019571335|nr:hypothetical protein [Erwinia endophytica]